ncbi:MAG TPA: D-alanyl-D-alanine carboxypeptidase/D-alanyl-D-alanine-endopeptidase [Pseudonocardiaceae bacterium]|nr:D-alanyl-D-alanine carboxypeptidase/D-alanyl-D-alanine-endopeptidase [Pseudonocardiaceae bacterium]
MQDRGESPQGVAAPTSTADRAAWPDLDSDKAKWPATAGDEPPAKAAYAWPGQDEPHSDVAKPTEPDVAQPDPEPTVEWPAQSAADDQADAVTDEPAPEPEAQPEPAESTPEPEPEPATEAAPEAAPGPVPGPEPEPARETQAFSVKEPEQETAAFPIEQPAPAERTRAFSVKEPEQETDAFPIKAPDRAARTLPVTKPTPPVTKPTLPVKNPTPPEPEPDPTARMTPVADSATTQFLPRIDPPAPPPRPVRPTPRPQPRSVERVGSTQLIPVYRDAHTPAETTQLIPTIPYDDDNHYDDNHYDDTDDEPAIPRPSTRTNSKPKSRNKKRRALLIAAGSLIVVIAVGVAVVITQPAVAVKLGLRSVAGPVTQPPPSPVVFSAELKPPNDSAPMPTNAGVAGALGPSVVNPVVGSLAGTVLDAASGQVLWDHGSTGEVAPASTNKVLTSAAALLSLGAQTTLDTTVVAGGQPGTIVLVGGGDPTLSSLPAPQQSVYPGAARISDLAAQVKAHNPGQITRIVVDTSRFGGPTSAPGWDPASPSQHNWAPIQPAMLDGGRLNPTQADTARTYSPALVAGQALATQLGVPTSAVAVTSTPTPAGGQILGIVHSATVPDLVTNLLQISDNVLAEMMGRAVAIADNQPPTFTGSVSAVMDVLRRNGFDTTGMSLSDSSGLSPNDRLQPRLLAQVLRVAASSDTSDPRVAKLRPLLLGLPIAGSPVGDGTLADRYQTAPSSAGRGWVRAKTGTLTEQGVFALAGVVLDADGRMLVFAFVSNQAPSTLAPSVLDTMAAALRGCGCR